MNRCIITVKIDVTDVLPNDWEKMESQEIRDYFGDTPDVMWDGDFEVDDGGNIVQEVRKIKG